MDLYEKIIYGLERLSEVFKTLLWEKAKKHGISPIQIQILLFVANHKKTLCNVSQLAKEFNLTKATISDAVRVLNNKRYLERDYAFADKRSYSLVITKQGKSLTNNIAQYAFPLEEELKRINEDELNKLYSTLTDLIFRLNQNGILKVQRTCFGCSFYEKKNEKHFCHLLKKDLQGNEIRLDCSEYKEKPLV